MPTYEYLCEACGHELEMFQRMTDNPARKCPHCRKMRLKRRLGTGAGIIFKGSGFYETDYRRAAGGGARAAKDSGGADAPKAEQPAKAADKGTADKKGKSGKSD